MFDPLSGVLKGIVFKNTRNSNPKSKLEEIMFKIGKKGLHDTK